MLESQGRTEEAVEAYQQAIRLLPTDPRPVIALGRLQTTCGHYAEAIRLLESGIAMKPHYTETDARLSLADALERSGAIEKAIAQWQVVMHMEPSYPSRHLPMDEAKRKTTNTSGRGNTFTTTSVAIHEELGNHAQTHNRSE